MTLSRRRTFKAFLITALLFFANSLSLRAQNDSFYNGRTVRIIVGSTPGGFYDRWAQLLSRYIPKYIAGNPNFVVQNMPGASSVVAANYVYTCLSRTGSRWSCPSIACISTRSSAAKK